MRKPVLGVSNQEQKKTGCLKFRIQAEEELYLCSKIKGADQLCSTADLGLCFRIGKNPVFS